MDKNEQLFKNLLPDFSRKELIEFLNIASDRSQLINVLENFDALQKLEIINFIMEGVVQDSVIKLFQQSEAANIHELAILEGRIHLLKLMFHMAVHKDDIHSIIDIDNRINQLFFEYRVKGGTKWVNDEKKI